ncbi:hypothetical protein [Streptomyces sp. NPDC048527]|uniref:hypothetical protein n=1 Tax=Streptomyces sp. NPDC048527 TaxID=3365568 RepID=UPI003722AFDB
MDSGIEGSSPMLCEPDFRAGSCQVRSRIVFSSGTGRETRIPPLTCTDEVFGKGKARHSRMTGHPAVLPGTGEDSGAGGEFGPRSAINAFT